MTTMIVMRRPFLSSGWRRKFKRRVLFLFLKLMIAVQSKRSRRIFAQKWKLANALELGNRKDFVNLWLKMIAFEIDAVACNVSVAFQCSLLSNV